MIPTDPTSPGDSADLPPALLADLRRVDRAPAVPKAVDSAIRAHALGYFARQRRIKLWTRWGSAVAAAVVVGVGLRFALLDDNEKRYASEAAPAPAAIAHLAKEDIDRNGVVDVLDAFAVARSVRGGRPLPAGDVNGDGVVDRIDVELIATKAVSVGGAKSGSGGTP